MFPKYEYRNTSVSILNMKQFIGYPARFHKHLEMVYVTDGELRATVDGKNFVLHKGELYIAFPNILHAANRSDVHAVVIIADNDLFSAYVDTLTHFKPVTPYLLAHETPEIVGSMFLRLSQLGTKDYTQQQPLLAGYISAILGEILSKLTLVERSSDSDLVQQLILYLLNNYTREVTLDDVAKELNYSKCYISRVITNTFACNFRSLINSYRISMAQSLLLASQNTVSGIAYECGFKNQSSFNRIFLKHCGVTPSQFRHQNDVQAEKPNLCYR